MKVTKIILGATIISLSSYAIAGIKDKKSMKESEMAISTSATGVKAACGNANLESKVDWSNWDKYDYKKMGSKKSDVLGYTGGLAKSILESMADLCKDADYKGEISKITALNFSGKNDQSEMYAAFKLDGNTLNIMLNADGVSSWKNADLLKAVWE